MTNRVKTLHYQFRLNNGAQKNFVVRLQQPRMQLISDVRRPLPPWTELTFHQCPHCPLDARQHTHCPVAVNLVEIIDLFKDCLSTEEAHITIISEVREYYKKVPLPVGVSSLIGLHMVTSGCPILDKLRPMVGTHLPFATVQETMYRAISMYLLSQYFLAKEGHTPDWELKRLAEIYEDISQVNQSFSERLLSIPTKDASLNALVDLDCFAKINAFSILETGLEELKSLFHPYLETARS